MQPTLTWFLTWTTYGTWLPGDERGFVSTVTDFRPGEDNTHRVRHAAPGTDYDRDAAGLRESARKLMTAEPVWLTGPQAAAASRQFRDTARHREWHLHASAVMANHAHLVVTAPGAVRGESLLRDFKSYASRALNATWPRATTWWTESGSRRPLPTEDAVARTVRYVLDQPAPLALDPDPTTDTPERGASAP